MSNPEYAADDVATFLLALGRSQLDAGFPVDTVTNTLRAAAHSYGFARPDVAVIPSAVFLNLDETHRGLFTAVSTSMSRLDQSTAIAAVARHAATGELDPVEGLAELERLPLLPPRFPYWATILGYGLVAAGFALVFRFDWWDPVIAGVLGMLVGVISRATRANSALNVLMTPLLGSVCSALAFLISNILGTNIRPVHIAVASLIVLLPGAALTRATMEMASGHIVSGSSRMLWSVMQMVLLAAGIVVGARIVGVESLDVVYTHHDRLPLWVAFFAVLIYAIGQGLANNMPKGSIWIVVLLLLGAQLLMVVGTAELGPVFASGVAATITLLAAIVFEERGRSHVPAISLFTPVFWLLVPGAVGVIGLANTLSGASDSHAFEIQSGTNLLLESGSVIIAILVGMQVASLVGEAGVWRRNRQKAAVQE